MFNQFKEKTTSSAKKEFGVCWGQPESNLFAIFPTPVNADECFKKAGYVNFQDANDEWEAKADSFLDDLLNSMEKFGPAKLLSEPLRDLEYVPYLDSLSPLKKEIVIRTGIEDNIPDCEITFGDSGIKMKTGDGHHIFWLEVQENRLEEFKKYLDIILHKWSAEKIDLDWNCLKLG